MGDRERYIAALQPILDALNDTTTLDSDEGVLRERSAGLYAQLDALVNDNARQSLEPAAYKVRFSELNGRYEAVNAQLAGVVALKKSRQVRQESIQRFIQNVQEREHLLVDFDEPLWRGSGKRGGSRQGGHFVSVPRWAGGADWWCRRRVTRLLHMATAPSKRLSQVAF